MESRLVFDSHKYEWNDELAILNVDKQVEKNVECRK